MSKESHGGLMTSMERSIPCKSGVKSNIAFMHDIIIIFTLQNNFCEITHFGGQRINTRAYANLHGHFVVSPIN